MSSKQQPLKIAFDAKRAFNNSTGLGNYARFVIRTLVHYYPQHTYYLFTPQIAPQFADFMQPLPNVKIVSPQSLIGKTFASLWRTYAIGNICTVLGIDVYWGLSNELPVGIEYFNGKKIVTIHDLIFLRYPGYYNNIDRYIYQRKFSYAARVANCIVAASNQTAVDVHTFLSQPQEKITTIYQDCDPIFRKDSAEQNDMLVLEKNGLQRAQYILCVGTIESRKNQQVVLEAFHQAAIKGIKLVFVGRKTAYVSVLERYIIKHNLEDRVLFIDNLPHQHLPALYHLAYASVYASKFEGFGIPILEAMCCGVPVIAAATSSLTEVGGEACLYFAPDDVPSLVSHLHNLADADMRSTIIQNGLVRAESFKTDVIAPQMLNVLGI